MNLNHKKNTKEKMMAKKRHIKESLAEDHQKVSKLSSTILLKVLIKEAIKQQNNEAIIYKENGGFDNLSGHMQSNPLYATFIQPFTDIVQTGAYAIKRIGSVATSEFVSVLKQSAAAVIPFISADTMDEIKAETKAELADSIGKLDTEYGDVLNRNIDAVLNQTDVWGLAFLFNPALLIGSKFLLKAPQAAASLLGAIVGGPIGAKLESLAAALHTLDTDPASLLSSQSAHGGYNRSSSVDWGQASSGGMGGYDDYGMGDYLEEQVMTQPQQPTSTSHTRPQVDQNQMKAWVAQKKKQINQQIDQILKNPTVGKSIASSAVGQKMQQAGINAVVKAAKNNLAFNDWNQMLQRHSKNPKLKQLDQQLTDAMKKQNMDEKQIIQEKNKLVPDIKNQMKKMLIQQVQSHGVKGNSGAGQQSVNKAIQQINSIH